MTLGKLLNQLRLSIAKHRYNLIGLLSRLNEITDEKAVNAIQIIGIFRT